MADNPKYSYKFLRSPVGSETEIVTQRQIIRREAQAVYNRLGITTKSADLLKQAVQFFSRMETMVAFEVRSKITEVNREQQKLGEIKKKTADQKKRAKELTTAESDLKKSLEGAQARYAALYTDMYTMLGKLDSFRAEIVNEARDMEEELEQTFNQHRRQRETERKKKETEAIEKLKTGVVAITDPAVLTAAIVEESRTNAAAKQAANSLKSMVVRKDSIPKGFTPIK